MLLLSVLSWRISQAWNHRQIQLNRRTWSLWPSQATVCSLWSCWCGWCSWTSKHKTFWKIQSASRPSNSATVWGFCDWLGCCWWHYSVRHPSFESIWTPYCRFSAKFKKDCTNSEIYQQAFLQITSEHPTMFRFSLMAPKLMRRLLLQQCHSLPLIASSRVNCEIIDSVLFR